MYIVLAARFICKTAASSTLKCVEVNCCLRLLVSIARRAGNQSFTEPFHSLFSVPYKRHSQSLNGCGIVNLRCIHYRPNFYRAWA